MAEVVTGTHGRKDFNPEIEPVTGNMYATFRPIYKEQMLEKRTFLQWIKRLMNIRISIEVYYMEDWEDE